MDTAGIAFAGVFFRLRYDWDQVVVVGWQVGGAAGHRRIRRDRRAEEAGERMRCVYPSMLSGKSAIDDYVAAAEGFRATAIQVGSAPEE
ncbi:MAG: hypothetical protein R2705_01040 [Ilumatobacteraceae bacterium]